MHSDGIALGVRYVEEVGHITKAHCISGVGVENGLQLRRMGLILVPVHPTDRLLKVSVLQSRVKLLLLKGTNELIVLVEASVLGMLCASDIAEFGHVKMMNLLRVLITVEVGVMTGVEGTMTMAIMTLLHVPHWRHLCKCSEGQKSQNQHTHDSLVHSVQQKRVHVSHE